MKLTKHSGFYLAAAGLILLNAVFLQAAQENNLDAETILKEFIDDYVENDELPDTPVVFGMHITGPEESLWTISIDASKNPKGTLAKGLPDIPSFVCNPLYRPFTLYTINGYTII
ncbi:MAG: hypothetical protein ACOC57_07840 [Acidobacteriota bacterium]